MVAALPIIGWGLCKGVPMSYKMQNIETSTLQAGKFWNHHNSNSYTGVRSCNYSIHITWETTWMNLRIWLYICYCNSLCHMSRYRSIELIYHNILSIFWDEENDGAYWFFTPCLTIHTLSVFGTRLKWHLLISQCQNIIIIIVIFGCYKPHGHCALIAHTSLS